MIATSYVTPDHYWSHDAASIIYEESYQPEHIASVEPFVEEDQSFYRESLLIHRSYGSALLKESAKNISDLLLRISLGQLANHEEMVATTSSLADFESYFRQAGWQKEEVLDWDYSMSAPPPRASGTIPVKLEYMGRGKPLPADDPWQD
ncbi:MAG: hypothetical protein IPK63_10660 [Candidatus Competibacteraceae bacterium]|nr:hypothetical protein [Candidatus Competibacteraceae bacterium]